MGVRVGVNAAYARRYGCAPEALIGKSLRPLLTEQQRERLVGHFAALTPEEPVRVEQKAATTPLGRQT